MFSSNQGNTEKVVVAKIQPGEDLFEALNKILELHKVECGYIPLIQGCFTACRLLTVEANPECELEPTNHKKEWEGPMVFTGNGTIARDQEGNAFIHMHPTITKPNHEVMMGHLIAATVCLTTEVVIVSLNNIKMG